jgi:hypothetical protein
MSRTTISLEEAASVLVVRRRDDVAGHSMRPTTPIERGRSVIVLSTMVIAAAVGELGSPQRWVDLSAVVTR